jgi:hypothetical protein
MVRKPAAFIKTILASSGRKKTVQVLSRLGQWLEGLKSVQLFCRTTRVPGSNVPAVRLLRCEAGGLRRKTHTRGDSHCAGLVVAVRKGLTNL